ncbi:hypothetical protein M8013_22620 [Enterobacteriaceae bacterium H4N4]|uniref:Uncharacterized protein n=1 Tax=Silvania confinis TaxID=2926470 RepID=A0A9J6QT19_9ENTR|nr:hypothetical protein [Silvania confinis]MCU6671517.1 hypothetical protein [Silvania confinis]
MSDFLKPERVDECLSRHFPELWPSASHRALFCQQNAAGTIELYANTAVDLTPPHQPFVTISEHQLSPWITLLNVIEPLNTVIVAGQDLYATVLGHARRERWKVGVQRVVHEGDGQAPANFGTDAEQRAALRILTTRNNAQKRVVLIEILGTDLFYLQSNFAWTENAAFDLNICRSLTALCKLVIPQLVARKSITEIIVLQSASADSVYAMENMEPYHPLLRIETDPDGLATSNREELQQLLRRSSVGDSVTKNMAEWLSSARKRFAFVERSPLDIAAVTAEKTRLLRLFLQIFHSQDRDIIRGSSAELTQFTRQDEFTFRLRRAALLLARARLGELTTAHQSDIDILLMTSTENDIWWQPAITALTQHWVQHDLPDNWLAQLHDRGTAALLAVSSESEVNYDKIRTAWLRLVGSDENEFILPFATYRDEVSLGGNYRQLHRLVDAALAGEVNDKNITHQRKALLAERDRIQFYATLTFGRDYYSDQMIRRLLEKAKTAWGHSREHFTTEFLYLFSREQDVVEAERCSSAWINAYPEDDNAWFYQATVKREQGQTEEARHCFLQSATLTDYKKPALVEAALCLWAANNIDAAEAELWPLIDANDRFPPAYAVLGLIRIVAHDYAGALALFRQITLEDIDANGVLYPWLHCLLLQEGWATANAAFAESANRLSDQELSRYITGAALSLNGTEQGCQVAAHTFAPLLKFEEPWNSAIDTVMACCFKSGDWQTGRELALSALANPWGSESQALQLVYSFLYQSQAQDFTQGLALAVEFTTRFPDSFLLCNVAGELAEATGQSGETWFLRVCALLTAIPVIQRDERQSMTLALALCNLRQFPQAYDSLPLQVTEPEHILSRILIACVAGINDIDEFYSLAKAQLLSAEFMEVKAALHDHLTDLERYGQRGLIPDWNVYHAIAVGLFTPETDDD